MGTPHKHAEVLKAIADGKDVQHKRECFDVWKDANSNYLECIADPFNNPDDEWRIKPEPKPDSLQYMNVYKTGRGFGCTTSNVKTLSQCEKASGDFLRGRIKLVIDGETGKIKSAEVIA